LTDSKFGDHSSCD